MNDGIPCTARVSALTGIELSETRTAISGMCLVIYRGERQLDRYSFLCVLEPIGHGLL